VWDRIILLKYRKNKPAHIPLPPDKRRYIRSVPLKEAFPSIPITGITVSDHVPKDEANPVNRYFYKFQMWLLSVFGPHQDGLPPVSDDPEVMLRTAYGEAKRKLFPAPKVAEAFRHPSPDVGALAVAGPYYGYLRAVEGNRWEWDLRELGEFEHWPGLYSLGVRAVFQLDARGKSLECVLIECELGQVTPSDPRWELAKKITLCAITTHVSLIRHFNGVHLAIGAKFSIATRNHLPHDHPLCRLLWPHVYGSHYSNDLVTLGQMAPKGDFPKIFSFTHAGMCDLYERTHQGIKFVMYDPVQDALDRGVIEPEFETPGYDNLCTILAVFHEHARNYLYAYYNSDAGLQADEAVKSWISELQQIVPNGIPVTVSNLTRERLAHLIAVFIYIVVVEHELRGTFLWNYQLWTNQQPIRVYKNGQREPVDLYQRLVNANMQLNVKRTELAEDFSYLALDDRGADLFRNFRKRLLEVQVSMNDEPRLLWKLYPDMLNANMNA
jgi:arachidonate 15-lipoxygenase